VLVLMGRAIAPPPKPTTGMFRSIAEGVRVAFGRPLTRTLLVTMTLAAGLLMPMDALLLPLLARDHGWDAGQASLLVAVRSLGVGLIALRILMRGAFQRPGLVAALGLLLASIGLLGLAFLEPLPLTMAAAVISGLGVGTFTGHLLPLLMNSVEKEFQSRLQSVVVLCQSLALVVMNPLLGFFTDLDGIGITGVCLGIGVLTALIGCFALSRQVMREATVT
jgi:predicted MFS family arabinose efflux permease